MDRWLTPQASAPTEVFCRRLLIPLAVDWIAPINGALSELGKEYNWQQSDLGITVAETAAKYREIFDAFSQDHCMVGTIFAHILAIDPLGSLPCDGATYNRVDYPGLYANLAAAFIIDADHFFVPDLRGRVIMGDGTGSGLHNRQFAVALGEEDHVLTTTELAVHTHGQLAHTHTNFQAAGANVTTIGTGAPQATAIPVVANIGAQTAINQNTGGGAGHNNIQPSIPLHYAIWAN